MAKPPPSLGMRIYSAGFNCMACICSVSSRTADTRCRCPQPCCPRPLTAHAAGCPSDRVAGAGCFGAAMMLRPELVAECCKAMCEAVTTPITVKCRLGESRLLG